MEDFVIDVHKAVHRNIISIVKPTRCTNVSSWVYYRNNFLIVLAFALH